MLIFHNEKASLDASFLLLLLFIITIIVVIIIIITNEFLCRI